MSVKRHDICCIALRSILYNTGPMKSHLESYNFTPDENRLSVIGKSQHLPKLLTLEPLFINTKDGYSANRKFLPIIPLILYQFWKKKLGSHTWNSLLNNFCSLYSTQMSLFYVVIQEKLIFYRLHNIYFKGQ